MASGSLVGQSDAGEKQDKFYTRKNQSKSQNPKSVPRQYNQQQYSKKILASINTDDNSIPVASDDSSSQPAGHNRREPSHGNAFPGYAKFDRFVKISFDLNNREEVRALKRKLASELEQVTSLVKRLDTTQTQLSKTVHRNAGELEQVTNLVKRLDTTKTQLSKTVHRNAGTVSANKNGNNQGKSGEKKKMAPKTNQFYKNLDVVSSEKLNPMESNKKLKSNTKGNELVPDKDLGRLFQSCRNLLERLMKHKYGWVFNKPVDVKGLGLKDYYTIIKHPMDLGTVKARLSKNLYKTPTEFGEDVRITFSNAMLYNPKGQDAHIMAEELSKIFEDTWKKIEAEYNFSRQPKMARNSDFATPIPKTVPASLPPVHTPTPAPPLPVHSPTSAHPVPVHTATPVYPPSASPPPSGPLEARTLEGVDSVPIPDDLKRKATDLAHQDRILVPKKPKANNSDKRDMTYEEKQRLSMNLQELPSDKLDHVVQIIKKRNPVLSQQDDEIEVDIDTFDPETLWELDRFVTNYNKILSKNKGKAGVAHQATAEAGHTIQDSNMEPIIAEAPKETETVEKIVSTSSPVLEEKHGDKANESSSSSGSSSHSGSSSSDSSSGSSSGYRSPADN